MAEKTKKLEKPTANMRKRGGLRSSAANPTSTAPARLGASSRGSRPTVAKVTAKSRPAAMTKAIRQRSAGTTNPPKRRPPRPHDPPKTAPAEPSHSRCRDIRTHHHAEALHADGAREIRGDAGAERR